MNEKFREILFGPNLSKIRVINKGKEKLPLWSEKECYISMHTMSIERNQHLLKYYIFMHKSGMNKRSDACYAKIHKTCSFSFPVFMNQNVIFSQ